MAEPARRPKVISVIYGKLDDSVEMCWVKELLLMGRAQVVDRASSVASSIGFFTYFSASGRIAYGGRRSVFHDHTRSPADAPVRTCGGRYCN